MVFVCGIVSPPFGEPATVSALGSPKIHEPVAADTKQLPALVNATAKNFAIAEVSADKAHGRIKNTETIANLGATPIIPFKTVHTGQRGQRRNAAGDGSWAKAFSYFLYHREEFLDRYHKRSNVESTFSIIKRKFGDSLMSKSNTAMINEVLAKVLCQISSC